MITEGIARGCRNNTGGAYQFYIATYPTLLDVTEDGTTKVISDITNGSTAVEYFPFIPNKNTSNYAGSYQVSLENGTKGVEQKATMVFGKMEQSKTLVIDEMAKCDTSVIFKDRNDNFWLMGEKDAVALSGGSEVTGTALADLNGYNVEMTAMEKNGVHQILSDGGNTSSSTNSIIINASTGVLTVVGV